MLAYPTPLPEADAVQRRQLDSIISSIINGGSGSTTADSGTTANGGGGTTSNTGGTTTGANGGAGGTTTNGVTTTPGVTTPTTTRESSTTLPNGATASVSTAAGATGSGGSVVTQVSTVAGGQTVVIVRTTAGGSQATSGASNGSSSSSSNGGLIGGVVGGVVGGLALLTAIILIFIVWRRRQSRTGHGWFLCFGQRPKRGNKDFDVDWPTFDPTVGAAGVGGTLGSRSGRGGTYSGHGGGTLPDLDETDAYSSPNDMREIGSGGHDAYGGSYYGAAGAGVAAGAIGGHHKSPSEGGAAHNGWAPSSAGAGTVNGDLQSPVDDAAPTYDHLDPPEVREERAREQAEAHAQAMAAYNQSNTSPPMYQSSAGHYPMGSSSPPPRSINQRPLSDHRLSTGTTNALASNNYFADEADPESGTLQQPQHHALHLHNPDR